MLRIPLKMVLLLVMMSQVTLVCVGAPIPGLFAANNPSSHESDPTSGQDLVPIETEEQLMVHMITGII